MNQDANSKQKLITTEPRDTHLKAKLHCQLRFI